MQNLEERAKDYAKRAKAHFPELCAFDFIAGAKEERILVCEWLERNAPQVVARFKTDFNIEFPKYYGDDESRAHK